MSDNDKPPLMFPWINSPRVRRAELWLWNHPKTAMLLTFLAFGLISSPAWFSDFWALFSTEAPVPTIMNWGWNLPTMNFSWYWVPMALGAAMFLIIAYMLTMGRRAQLQANEAHVVPGFEPDDPVDGRATERETVEHYRKEIVRLEDLARTHSMSADAHETELTQFKAKYAVAVTMADYQWSRIGEFVQVVRACTHDAKLDDDLPTIRWGFLIGNSSVFRIAPDGEIGSLYFEGRRLTQPREVIENSLIGMWPDREGSIVFEQQLSLPEAQMMKRRPDGKFDFEKVTMKFKGYNDNGWVKSAVVIIPPTFKAILGRCTDAQSQAKEGLELEAETLQAQLSEAKALAGELVITGALYGVPAIHEEDVTGILAKMVANNSLSLDGYYNDFLPDMVQTKRKQLQISYIHNGISFSVTVPENTKITLPIAYRGPLRGLPPR